MHGRRLAAAAREIIDTGQRKELDLRILLPVEDLRSLPDKTIWPSIYRQLLDLVREHRSTLIFVNNRRLAERLTANLNDLAGETDCPDPPRQLGQGETPRGRRAAQVGRACPASSPLPRSNWESMSAPSTWWCRWNRPRKWPAACNGSAGPAISSACRAKAGSSPRPRGISWNAPPSLREMRHRPGRSRPMPPRTALTSWRSNWSAWSAWRNGTAEELFTLVRRAYPYRNLPRAQFDQVLAMLAGSYETNASWNSSPRIFWDRVNAVVRADRPRPAPGLHQRRHHPRPGLFRRLSGRQATPAWASWTRSSSPNAGWANGSSWAPRPGASRRSAGTG